MGTTDSDFGILYQVGSHLARYWRTLPHHNLTPGLAEAMAMIARRTGHSDCQELIEKHLASGVVDAEAFRAEIARMVPRPRGSVAVGS